jgi:hypothetical protein
MGCNGMLSRLPVACAGKSFSTQDTVPFATILAMLSCVIMDTVVLLALCGETRFSSSHKCMKH